MTNEHWMQLYLQAWNEIHAPWPAFDTAWEYVSCGHMVAVIHNGEFKRYFACDYAIRLKRAALA